ncbi:ExeA family protein [Aquisalinus flavus]|uniref:AAA+ ATPase domain-containing protein n=1 Tax=Aquisalinus flavus TaxID=1526572 RepID=A0A8J2V609_9PROT|nr:AAA family ATPase [Aquisalinus flavus]MBD0427189.1 AAA family ATPase [Aquisalinus flavus]UNE47005.1 AAA family ATPase [Aquisalinus flavus]GGC99056.1 hypothetical protein GCM10011342_05030 [Aquisalinus flavus]
MIEDYFGLIKAPFKLSADPYFYFDSPTHRKALSYLQYGIQQAEGFVVITGDTGVGKTTLVHQLLDGLDNNQIIAATMDISHVAPGQTLAQVLSAFRIEPAGAGAGAGLEALQEFLIDQIGDGRQAVLIVDEAQNLSPQTLEELRVLTNLSYDGLPLLQVFLIGQSEMQEMIARPDMEQFRQRVIASYHVSPLTRDETAAYIDHRLYAAGFKDEQSLFTDRAQDAIYHHTGGVPRRINKLCARVLLQTALDEKDFVDAACVQTVIDDLDEEMGGAQVGHGEEPVTVTQEDIIPVQDQPVYTSAEIETAPRESEEPDINEPEVLTPAQADVSSDDTVDDVIDIADETIGSAIPAPGAEPPVEEDEGFAADEYDDLAAEAGTVSGSGAQTPSNVYPIFSTRHGDAETPEDEVEDDDDDDTDTAAMIAEDGHDHEPAKTEEPEATVPPQTESRTEEEFPMSVLDRLHAAKRRYFPGQSASNEGDRPQHDPATPTGDDEFEELGRQLRMNTQLTGGNVLEEAVLSRDPDERDERIAALKNDLALFLEEVRSGLGDLEQSMHVVNDKITEIEAYQNGRNGLLKQKLDSVETMLDRLQERK